MRLGEAGAPLQDRIDSEIDNNLGYIEQALDGHDYILAGGFTGADVQLSFVGEVGPRLRPPGALPQDRRLGGSPARPPGLQGVDREGRRLQSGL